MAQVIVKPPSDPTATDKPDNALVFVIALLVSWFLGSLLRIWQIGFIADRKFTVYGGWLSLVSLLPWLVNFTFFTVVGAVLARALRTPHPARWAAGLGAACALLQWLFSSIWFAPQAGVSEYVWYYGGYLVPPLAAATGALLWSTVTARRRA